MSVPTATAHVTLQDGFEADRDVPSRGKSSDLTPVVSAATRTDAAAQQAYMPFSTGPRRSVALTRKSACRHISSHVLCCCCKLCGCTTYCQAGL